LAKQASVLNCWQCPGDEFHHFLLSQTRTRSTRQNVVWQRHVHLNSANFWKFGAIILTQLQSDNTTGESESVKSFPSHRAELISNSVVTQEDAMVCLFTHPHWMLAPNYIVQWNGDRGNVCKRLAQRCTQQCSGWNKPPIMNSRIIITTGLGFPLSTGPCTISFDVCLYISSK